MKLTKLVQVAAVAAGAFALTALPAAAQSATAALKNAEGKDVGSVKLTQTPAGVLLALTVKGLPAGEHAFHSRLEWVSVQDMEAAVRTIVHLAAIWEERA